MHFLDTIFNAIFPSSCAACGTSGTDLCRKCLYGFPKAERENEDWIFPLFDYRHPPVQKSIWLLKYKGHKGLANIFAEAMHGKMMEELSELSLMENFREPVLIPVPLSKRRYRERGYNQAELICEELMKIDGRENNFKLEKDVLLKTKETEHQTNIKDRSDRLKNLAGSFSVKDNRMVKGRNIILVDDVTTTGATLNEAKRTLEKAGARKVIAFTVAH